MEVGLGAWGLDHYRDGVKAEGYTAVAYLPCGSQLLPHAARVSVSECGAGCGDGRRPGGGTRYRAGMGSRSDVHGPRPMINL
jgi:hypothetical protein